MFYAIFKDVINKNNNAVSIWSVFLLQISPLSFNLIKKVVVCGTTGIKNICTPMQRESFSNDNF